MEYNKRWDEMRWDEVTARKFHNYIKKVPFASDVINFWRILKKLRKLERINKERPSNTETRLCYLITNLNSSVTSVCVSSHTGQHIPPNNDVPLHTFTIFITVNESN